MRAHLGRQRSKFQTNFWLALDQTPGFLIASSATDWSRTTHLDVFLLQPSASSLSGSDSRHTRWFAPSFHELHLVLLQSQTSQLQVVRDSLNSQYKTPPSSSAFFTSLMSYLLRRRGVKFGWVAVVGCEKHVVNVNNDHSDEVSRTVTQAEEGRIQSEGFP